MKCTITINMDNAAFDNPGELARILRKAAELTEDGPENLCLRDINGNLVGQLKIIGKRD